MNEERNDQTIEYPFGKMPWIAVALLLVNWLQAVWAILDKGIIRFLSAQGLNLLLVRYLGWQGLISTLLFSAVLLLLYLLAVRATNSLPARGAFLLGVGAAVCPMLYFVLARISAEHLLAGGILMTLAGILQVGMFLLLAVNREISRDARICAGLAASAFVVRTVCTVVTFFATWKLQQNGIGGIWPAFLAYAGAGSLLTGITASILSGTVYIFMRAPVRTPQYPPKRI